MTHLWLSTPEHSVNTYALYLQLLWGSIQCTKEFTWCNLGAALICEYRDAFSKIIVDLVPHQSFFHSLRSAGCSRARASASWTWVGQATEGTQVLGEVLVATCSPWGWNWQLLLHGNSHRVWGSAWEVAGYGFVSHLPLSNSHRLFPFTLSANSEASERVLWQLVFLGLGILNGKLKEQCAIAVCYLVTGGSWNSAGFSHLSFGFIGQPCRTS